jgi:hypothetical protein
MPEGRGKAGALDEVGIVRRKRMEHHLIPGHERRAPVLDQVAGAGQPTHGLPRSCCRGPDGRRIDPGCVALGEERAPRGPAGHGRRPATVSASCRNMAGSRVGLSSRTTLISTHTSPFRKKIALSSWYASSASPSTGVKA